MGDASVYTSDDSPLNDISIFGDVLDDLTIADIVFVSDHEEKGLLFGMNKEVVLFLFHHHAQKKFMCLFEKHGRHLGQSHHARLFRERP